MSNIAAFVLTITSIEERLSDAKHLCHQLATTELLASVEIVPAIYWKDENSASAFMSRYPAYTFAPAYLNTCRKGQVCCTLSHISLWQKLMDSEFDGAFVFEDDIYITDPAHLQEIVEALPSHGDIDWLRIHLHKRFRDEIVAAQSHDIFVQDPSLYGFAAYYVSRQGAVKLLRHFHDIDDNVDKVIPRLGKAGSIQCKTIHKVVVEHHPFEGTDADLQARHEIERSETKLQKSPSTIYSSPLFEPHEPLFKLMTCLRHARQLEEHGCTVLKGVFDAATIEGARRQVLSHRHLPRNTRPTPSSLHLAGFHRFPELESLHTLLSTHEAILGALRIAVQNGNVRTIGLSDITVNRSQEWHTDLLRGKYRHYLQDEAACWTESGFGLYKALLYLQEGASLKVIEGSHLVRRSLESDRHSEPENEAMVRTVPVNVGDVVLMDIRMAHRGSSEEVFASGEFDQHPKILITTVLGRRDSPITKAMELGNFHRLMDWDERSS